jgi:thioredoxin-like negative regulator of GroEL
MPVAVPKRRVVESTDTDWWSADGGNKNLVDVHSEEEFNYILALASQNPTDTIPVVVEFYANWCRGCRTFYPKLLRIMNDEQQVLFVKVNFDENKMLAKKLGVMVSPSENTKSRK